MKTKNIKTVLSILILGAISLLAGVAVADAPKVKRNPPKKILKQILINKLTVWKKEEKRVFVSHCRNSKFGCEKRVDYFVDYIYHYAKIYNLDPVLMTAIAWHESRFSAFVKGSVGERGIFQINPKSKWGKELKFVMSQTYRNKCRNKPGECQDEVVEKASWLFSRCLLKCGNKFKGLGLYNTGRCGGNSRYSKRVLKYYKEFSKKLSN